MPYAMLCHESAEEVNQRDPIKKDFYITIFEGSLIGSRSHSAVLMSHASCLGGC